MRGLAGLALAAVFLGGCQQESANPAPMESSAAAPAVPAPSNAPASLVGEWRVAGLDGQPIDAPIGIALSIQAGEIGFGPRCAGFTWEYSYSAGVLTTTRLSPTAICEIGHDPVLVRLAAALDQVRSAQRTPANAIELSGGDHTVTLFSQ